MVVGDPMSRLIYADQIVAGNRIILPGRKRPVTVIENGQLSDPGRADYFEFACESPQGYSAVRLHRSQQVEVVG